ncbi:MAG: VWA domain-containing protein, partial [Deltaproteobacteria bacterium]|nr:VWA domain-containing protein [Deltaproteobacteria bacterium]
MPVIPSGCPSGSDTQTLGTWEYPIVDILVVVDNSRSMEEEQANLASNFPELIHTLLAPDVD